MQFLGRSNRKAEQILKESSVARLTSKEMALLHMIWLELTHDFMPEEIDNHDVVEFAAFNVEVMEARFPTTS